MGLNGFDFVGKGETAVQTMLESHPPEARAKRDLAFAPVKPGRLRDYAPWIRQIVDELIEAFAARGSCDFVEEFARPLPVHVMMRLFAISEQFWPMLYEWSDLESSGLSWLSPEQRERQLGNARRLGDFLTELVATVRGSGVLRSGPSGADVPHGVRSRSAHVSGRPVGTTGGPDRLRAAAHAVG
jgi:cytochrome P450